MKLKKTAKKTRSTGGRAPQGARGLKLSRAKTMILPLSVAPRKGRVG